ncbi:MAG TPA: hypothetical protein VFB63_21415 [Bryobacteraceae bacterium]|nr:hypothetical protein [Bryobacteraceae bacterium]
MPALYVENVPEELYEALRARPKENRTSISSEVVALLSQHVPTAKQLAARHAFYQQALKFRAQRPASSGPFPSAEEMLREDRER